jgi:hypothetical protein
MPMLQYDMFRRRNDLVLLQQSKYAASQQQLHLNGGGTHQQHANSNSLHYIREKVPYPS